MGNKGPSVVPRDEKEAEWAQQRQTTPTGEPGFSAQKTLVFSDIPTLPPIDDETDDPEEEGAIPEDDLPTASVDRESRLAALAALDSGDSDFRDLDESGPIDRRTVEEYLPERSVSSDYDLLDEGPGDPEDEPTVHSGKPLIVDDEPPPAPTAPTAVDPDDDADEGEGVFEDADEDVPLVRTQDPAPVRVSLPDDPMPSLSYTPVYQPRQAMPDIDADPLDGWNEIAVALEAEAGVAGPRERGVYLFRSGWVRLHQLGENDQARALYEQAAEVECAEPLLHRERADLALADESWEQAADCLASLAGCLEGSAAAETYREAAALKLHKLDDAAGAADLLRKGLEADPEDYGCLLLMKDALPGDDEERAAVLLRVAKLLPGLVAAEHTYQAATVLPESSDEVDTLLGEALALDARHAPSFGLLERRLLQANDHETLAELYKAEVRNAREHEAGWWKILAGRHLLLAGKSEAGNQLLAQAGSEGWSCAAVEAIARHAQRKDWSGAATALQTAARQVEPSRAAWMWFRLGWLRESRLGDVEGALAAYRACLEADPGAEPAREAITRVLSRREDRTELIEQLEKAVADGAKGLGLRLAEVAEEAGDHARAKTAYGMFLADDEPAAPIARAGLCRVLAAMEDWPALSELLEQRAGSVSSSELRTHLLQAAAEVGARPEPIDAERSIALYEQALTLMPGHLGVLESLATLLRARGADARLAAHHRNAAEATAEPELRRLLSYRAARLYLRADDISAAQSCIENLLEAEPGFEPARAMRLELAARGGSTEPLADHHRSKGDDAWNRFAAAVVTGIEHEVGLAELRRLVNEHERHRGARDALEVACEVAGDLATLENLLSESIAGPASPESARETLRIADVVARDGRNDAAGALLADLAGLDGIEAPIQPAVRLARRVGAEEAATSLLARIPERWARLERAALLGRRRRDLAVAEAELRDLMTSEEPEIAAHLAVTVGAAGDHGALVEEGERVLGRSAGHTSVRLMNTLWMAARLEEAGEGGEALAAYRAALQLAPNNLVPALGALRCALAHAPLVLEELADVESLDPVMMGVVLEQKGHAEKARQELEKAAALDPALPGVLHLQRLLESQKTWTDAYDVMMRRLALSRHESQREAVERRRRWMLAEKLAETDEAWTLYKQLHEDNPGDQAITEALARIAGARGETELAIGYLDELAGQVSDDAEAARYKLRVAEAYRSGGRRDDARKAYYDALGFIPTNKVALEGLKTLAQEDEDWPGLIEILQREAGLASAEGKPPILRRIAELSEERLDDTGKAIAAWRAVLEQAPSDVDALKRLLALAEKAKDWKLFVEMGNVLAALSRGAERTALLRQIGVVSADHLNREDAIRYLERAIQEEPPDLEAARRLEETYRRRGDHQAVARTLDIQGRVGRTDEEKVDALIRAAQHELSTRHDRDAAAVFYQRALELTPDHEAALRFMARHLFESGRFDEALPVCERLAPMVENDQDLDDFDTRMELAQFYYYYAEMLRLAEDGERSVPQYERALELNPTYVAALEAVGPLYKQTSQWKKALQVFRQLLQLSGGQGERHKVASTYTNLGLVERALGNAEKAKKRFNKALEIDPNHVEALKGMALLLEDRQDWSNLLNIYNNIIYHATVADDVIDAYMTKGRVLDDFMSRPDKAAQHYQRSLDFKPDQPIALLRLAELAMRRDAYQEAGDLAAKGAKLKDADAGTAALLKLCQAAAKKDAHKDGEAVTLMAEGVQTGALNPVPEGLLDDLEALRQFIKDRLPS